MGEPALINKADFATSYAAMFRASVARNPDVVGVVLDDQSRTYKQLFDAANWRARELKALGATKGDAIGLLMPNSFDFIEIFLGAAMLGVVVVPMNVRFKAYETAHIINDARLKIIFTTGAVDAHVNFKDLLHSALPGLEDAEDPWTLELAQFPALKAIVHCDGATPGCMVDANALRQAAVSFPAPTINDAPSIEDTQLIMYTSGTTAKPKGCIMPNRCLVATPALVAELFSIGHGDGWWCPLPMFHIGGLLFMSVCLTSGAKFIGVTYFDVDRAYDQFEREKPTVLYPLFPTIALPIIEDERFTKTSFDTVKYVFDVGPEEIQHRLQNAFPDAILMSAFGMTETTGIVTFNWITDSLEDRTTTVGHFLPGWEVLIVDPESRAPVEAGQPGEIAVRGPGLFGGYYNNPELTAQSFNDQGFFHTGDIGSINERGLLKYLGRLKDQMKVGGENVSALEVESFLATHPGIKLAQVVGIPDERYGEVPAAFIELATGALLDEKQVLDHCTGQIARFKIPQHVRFVKAWPMSATKIEKYKLRQQLLEELGEG